jgi:putative sigma-54 modulation protein
MGRHIAEANVDVVVVGKHTEIDASLRTLTEEKLERIAKYANDVRRVDVDYDELPTKRSNDSHICEILVHLKHHLVKGTAAAAEHLAALDLALEKVERQMRRLHERRVQRRNGAKGTRATEADVEPGVSAEGASAGGAPEGPEIVKTKEFEVKPMTPEEAALQMELLGHDFYLFRSTESGNAAVVYRRRDGALGLIEVRG